ncbi:uncharacterized protein [Diabrotica undecimpunctata]|uniref:uncharacterized protein n=1 Tax=Diabrotica undecimpunctata TaxID=50387 RepID=UPI003B63DACD
MDSVYPSTSTSCEINSGACHLCSKIFKNVELRNRHIKGIHNIDMSIKKINHIICPLCEQETNFKSHENLRKHLKGNHQVSIELITFEFSSLQEYETWKDMQKFETSYTMNRIVNRNEQKTLYYECNRSNIKGYKPNYKIRTEKSGGSIKIKGVCSSRLICKLRDQGQVSVSYWKTHAGHKEELRTMHLAKAEEKMIVEKLISGVPSSRILEDSRKLETPKLERLAVLTSQDLSNLSRKYNTYKKRDQNDMVATALKVQEWNANNNNYAFLFKKEGEQHDVLKKEDFALEFMNSVMEDKLREFHSIICMDGTHGTNKRGMDLTVVLIKDDRNTGFPVAFLLSNRLDQVVQEVFLGALKNRMQTGIHAEHFMSDDDKKYYNAWVKIMGNQPKRLLCTWYYFQNEERIKMWAHCYRKNSGINTNMAIESFNNLLKTNHLRRSAGVTIEKLLDTIDDLVDIKMWKRIIDIERPNANNYQDRVISKAHKMAETMKNKVEVKKNKKVYGQFQCECAEYVVRNILCKHVHLVRMHEEREGTNSVLDDAARCLAETSIIKSRHQEEINEFVRGKVEQTNVIQENTRRCLQNENFKNVIDSLHDLDDETYTQLHDKFMRDVQEARQEIHKDISDVDDNYEPPAKSPWQMRVKLKSTVLAIDRYGVSDRATAAIASSVLKDVGVISEIDSSYVVDKNKLRQEKNVNAGNYKMIVNV